MYVYDLSGLTRSRSEDRRMTWRGWDMPRRTFYLLLAVSIPMLPITAWGYTLMGIWVVVPVLAAYGLIYWLVETRTADGMRLRRYHALMDYQRSNRGSFIMCGQQISPGAIRLHVLRQANRPAYDDTAEALSSAREHTAPETVFG
ncbi:hypothetical protein [Branchiibius hedensis]|nr:hypothetical protein [Branchiibius hedensis]